MSKQFDARPDQQFAAAMNALIGERWRTFWKALPAAIANEDPEGVHQVRVASRRLRAAMDISDDSFPKQWYRPLHKTAKDVTSALGKVRDRDVQLEAFAKLWRRASAAERQGIDRLTARLEAERATAVDEMIAYLTKLDGSNAKRKSKRRFPRNVDVKPVRSGKAARKKGSRR